MTLREILGQPAAVRGLLRWLERDRLPHALLFTGPEGVGKKSTAVALAQALACNDRNGADSCGVCARCRRIREGLHPDLHWLEPEGRSIKIEQVREFFRRDVFLSPVESRRKVVVLDPAECLTDEAANSVLKILEEPPERVLILLVTSQPFAVLPTLRSRCQEVRFFPWNRSVLESWLEEAHGLAPDEAHALALLSGGRPAEALRLRDPERQSFRRRVLDALDGPDKGGWAQKLAEERESLDEALEIITSWYRDLLVLRAGGKREWLVNLDRREGLERAAAGQPPERWLKKVRRVLLAENQLQQNVNASLVLERLERELAVGAHGAEQENGK